MKINLSRLESRLQSLIEGSAARLFPNRSKGNDLAERLVRAMQSGIQPGPDGELTAPNLFTLRASPVQSRALQQNQALLHELIQVLKEAGAENGLSFPSPPVIRIFEDPDLSPGQIKVWARNSQADLSQTTDVEVEAGRDRGLPENAFLIVNGDRIFTLDQAVINIGRRPDNQLVIEDPRISRVHAQLRSVRGRFVIFDLDSTGGTFVNGERVSQSALYPGDVVTLAGVPLVYGQDPSGLGETQDLPPAHDPKGSRSKA